MDLADERLFTGSVPQPEDWLRLWRWAKGHSSNRTCSQFSLTEDFLTSTRTGLDAKCTERRAIGHMRQILAETIREEKRSALREASSISISLDDKRPFTLLLFKAVVPERGPGLCVKDCLVSGILVVPKTTDSMDMAAVDDDYALRQRDAILAGLKDFCTPLGGTFDEELHQRLLAKWHTVVVDAALIKTAEVLKKSVPGLFLVPWQSEGPKQSHDRYGSGRIYRVRKVLVSDPVQVHRDPTHAIRLAATGPEHAEARFRQCWEILFKGKGSLVPDISNSVAAG